MVSLEKTTRNVANRAVTLCRVLVLPFVVTKTQADVTESYAFV